MKELKTLSRTALLLGCAGLVMSGSYSNAQGTFGASTTQPTFDGEDLGYFNPGAPSTTGNPGEKWFAESSAAGQVKGQTFTLTADANLSSVTYRLGNSQTVPTKVYVVRIGAIDTVANKFFELHSEEITQTVDWGVGNTDSYGTWTLNAPVTLPGLPAGAVYGIDIAMKSSTTGWQTGIAYPTYLSTNPFAGGYKYSRPQDNGVQGSATPDMQNDSSGDREFHLDMASTTVVDATAPVLTSIDDQVGGGPIYTDQVQVAYILNFDEAVDASTIDLSDFENLGSGVNLDSVVSITPLTPFPVASSVQIVFGISGSGTLQLGVKSTTDIADYYSNTLDSPPVADDTTITVNVGTTPSTGTRYWDGTTIAGVTDGVSNGAAATWDLSTTNWDPGFGFAGPVVWDNDNNDVAVFSGNNYAVTVGEAVTVGGLQIDDKDIDITGSTINFGVAGEINTVDTAGSQTDLAIISSNITGADVTKTGPGWLDLTGNNTMASFTLSQGSIGQLPGGVYQGFGTGLLTINNGTRIYVTNNDQTTINNNIVLSGTLALENVSNSNKITEFNGNITLGSNSTINSKHTTQFDGVISDGGNNYQFKCARVGGTPRVILNNANTFGGGLNWDHSLLVLNHPEAWGSGTFIIGGNASNLDNTSGGAITMTVNNPQTWNGSFGFLGSNDLNLGTGAVNMAQNHTITVVAGKLTVGGGISQSGGTRTLIKDGAGTLALGGANTYAGNTTVSVGTLALIGGSQNSAITVNSGAAIDFTLGSPTTSTKALTLSAGHAVSITGAVNNSSDYLLMTASAINGTPTLAAPITDYELQKLNSNTELWLVFTGTAGDPEILVESPPASEIVSGGSKDFGVVTLGSNTSLEFTIKNTGTAELTLGGTPLVAVSGTDAADFTVTVDPSSSVAVAGSTTFTVQFAPSAAGARNAILTIQNNDADENPYTINISGTGQTTYDAWATANGLTGPDADPTADTENGGTGDGLSQLQEFAFGTNPNASDNVALTVTDGSTFTAGTPVVVPIAEGGFPIKFRYVRRKSHVADVIVYSTEFNTTAAMVFEADWRTPVPTPVVVSDAGGDYEVVQVPFPLFYSDGRKVSGILGQVDVTEAP